MASDLGLHCLPMPNKKDIILNYLIAAVRYMGNVALLNHLETEIEMRFANSFKKKDELLKCIGLVLLCSPNHRGCS